jgi:glutathione S-transferase
MALAQAGIAVRLREVALRDKPAELLAISPKGTVPVLQLPHGDVLDESLDIMKWALHQHDPQGWLTCADEHQARQWVLRNDTLFKPLLDRYKYATRHPQCSQQEHRQKALDAFVLPLDAALSGHGFLQGNKPCWADVALLPFLRQFGMVEPAWFAQAPLPELRRWLEGWTSSALFLTVMARHGAVSAGP